MRTSTFNDYICNRTIRRQFAVSQVADRSTRG